jgi:hypothetical protein
MLRAALPITCLMLFTTAGCGSSGEESDSTLGDAAGNNGAGGGEGTAAGAGAAGVASGGAGGSSGQGGKAAGGVGGAASASGAAGAGPGGGPAGGQAGQAGQAGQGGASSGSAGASGGAAAAGASASSGASGGGGEQAGGSAGGGAGQGAGGDGGLGGSQAGGQAGASDGGAAGESAGGAGGGAGGSGQGGGGSAGAAACQPGVTQPCYGGPDGTIGVGACKEGVRICTDDGVGFGACLGEVVPQVERCDTAIDDDCDGQALTCGAGEACSGETGLCEDPCSPSALGVSYVGCVYFPTVTANVVDPAFHFAVAVSNLGDKPATVEITKGAASIAKVSVAPGSVETIELPWEDALKGGADDGVPASSALVSAGAYKLVASRPVTVYQYSPIEYSLSDGLSQSNDASLLLPVNAWTGNYRVVSRQHWFRPNNLGSSYAGFFAVVASEDNTTVSLAAGPDSGFIAGSIAGLSTKGAGTVTLQQGDVLQLTTSDEFSANDLTGMLVAADRPVQVIGGHQCTFVPATIGFCDHLEESMFPLETLATEYVVTAPLIPNGDVPKAQIIRIVATHAGTKLTYDPPQPGAPTGVFLAGGLVDMAPTVSSFRLTSNYPIIVAQLMQGQQAGGDSGDPAMALAVATYQYRSDYLFHAPTNYEKNFVNITAPAGAAVVLDGVPVGGFTAIGAGDYAEARVQLQNLNGGNHSVTSDERVGISVYGYGQFTSYWYPGGLDLKVFK